MLNRISLIFFMGLILNLFSMGEIIKVSKLQQIEMKKFILKRDIFSPQATSSNIDIKKKIEKKSELEKEIQQKEELKAEISSTIVYEGFLLKNGKTLAMVIINGEFFIVSEGTKLLNRILIKKIGKTNILVEVESKNILIERKGVSDEYEKINF